MPSRKFASRRRSRRQSTVGKITPPLDVRSEDSISSLMKLVKKGPITIILVYADWCGHCHTYKPKFDEAAKNRKSPFQVASINDEMVNSVNERIKSMNKSAKPISVSGYPSVVSLTKNGDSSKDLPREAVIELMKQPVPKNVMQSAKNAPMNVMQSAKNVPMNVMENSIQENASENVSKNVMENTVQEAPMVVSQKKPNVNLAQKRVSQPLLRISGGDNFESPLAPKYLGGSLYKSLSSNPYQLGNPLKLFNGLSTRKHKKSKSRKSRK